MQAAGTMGYIPSGYVVLETATNNKNVIGVRDGAITTNILGNLQRYLKMTENDSASVDDQGRRVRAFLVKNVLAFAKGEDIDKGPYPPKAPLALSGAPDAKKAKVQT